MIYSDIQGKMVMRALNGKIKSLGSKPINLISLQDKITVSIGAEKNMTTRNVLSFTLKSTAKIEDTPNGWIFPKTQYGTIEIIVR